MWRALLLIALVVGGASPSNAPDAPTVRRYFGEPVPGLAAVQLSQFDRGAQLFAKDWSPVRTGVGNAPNCVACHSVPTPGGSGMTQRALVAVDVTKAAGSREEVIQRDDPALPHAEFRRTPALFGIGYLEAVRRDDGSAPFTIGSFGAQSDLTSFVSSAFATELGIGTTRHCPRNDASSAYPSKCPAQLTESDLQAVVTYLRLLAPPAPPSRDTKQRRILFRDVGCAECHTVAADTGEAPVAILSGQRIYPFTDLRAHEIGTSGRGPIRTSPLWGLNSYGPPYLHDGSATSIDGAVRAHGGEATRARTAFESLRPEERAELLDYLRSF